MSKNLYLLDAYALIYRSYYAFIKNPRYNSPSLGITLFNPYPIIVAPNKFSTEEFCLVEFNITFQRSARKKCDMKNEKIKTTNQPIESSERI